MDERFARLAARAAEQHNVVTIADFDAVGISRSLRAQWLRLGVIERIGVRSFGIVGAPRSWQQQLAAGLADLGPLAVLAGRSAAALHQLDGFRPGAFDFLVPRTQRNRVARGRVVSTTHPLLASDVCRVDGLRCLRVERLILDAALFDFTAEELENAIDSGIRLRLIAESRLLARVERERAGAYGCRRLGEALVDAGGESRLERAFLRILRRAGLPRPALQVTHRDGLRVIARADTAFGAELVIEVEGHATHSTRRQRQRDEQRRTELTLRGKRVITFTYDDVFGRPEWTVARVREALSRDVA